MFGYAAEPDVCWYPQKPKWKRIVQERWFFRKSIFAPFAQSLLRRLSPDNPRFNCPLTSFLTRIAAWDENGESAKTEQGKAKKRRLISLRFDGD